MASTHEPSEAVLLREATVGDLAAINDIYNHYVLTCTCTWQDQPDSTADRQAWFEARSPRYPGIVAELAGEVVGWGSLSPFGGIRGRHAYRYTVEDSVYVRDGRRGRGIGKLILADLVRRSEALGYRSIMASVSADRTASIRLHEGLGFVKVGHLREVAIKFDRWLDLIYLQKML